MVGKKPGVEKRYLVMSYDPNAATPNQYMENQLHTRRFGAKLTASHQEGMPPQTQGKAAQQLDFPSASPQQAEGAGLMGAHWSSQLPFQSMPAATPSPWNASPSHHASSPSYSLSDTSDVSAQSSQPSWGADIPASFASMHSSPFIPLHAEASTSMPPTSSDVSSSLFTPPKKRKKSLLIIALLAVLLIGGLSYYIYSYTHIAQQTNESNERAATATVEVNAQATALTSAYPFSKDLALNDTLKDNSQKQGWIEDRYCTFDDKSYKVRDPEKNTYYTCPALKSKFSNFTYQVSMQITKGLMAGLTFRGDDVKYKYYAFVFNSDGSYALLLYTGRDKSPKSLYTGISTQFKTHAENQIAISAIGSSIRLFVNRQLLASVDDDTLAQGQIGVLVYTQKEETQAIFKDAKVWKVA